MMISKNHQNLPTTIAIALLLVTSGALLGVIPRAHALSNSMKVAYVTDFGSGLCDPTTGGAG